MSFFLCVCVLQPPHSGHSHWFQRPVCLQRMEVFQEWQRYLASKSVGECMRQDAQLTIVSPDITVLQLVQVFVENDLRAAPVDFGNGKYEFVDYIDLLKHLCALLDAKQDDAAAVLPEFLTTVIRDVANLSGRNPFVPISTSQTMLDVCKTFAEAKRVPIVDSDGSLKDIVTAQDLIRCALEGVPTSLEEFGSLNVLPVVLCEGTHGPHVSMNGIGGHVGTDCGAVCCPFLLSGVGFFFFRWDNFSLRGMSSLRWRATPPSVRSDCSMSMDSVPCLCWTRMARCPRC